MVIIVSHETQVDGAYNKPLKALASLAGTVTRWLCRFAPDFSPCVTAPYVGVKLRSNYESFSTTIYIF